MAVIAEILVVAWQGRRRLGRHQHHDQHARQQERLRRVGEDGEPGVGVREVPRVLQEAGEYAQRSDAI